MKVVWVVLALVSATQQIDKSNLDKLWNNRHHLKNPKVIVEEAKRVLQAYPNDPEVLWKCGRAYYFYASYFVPESNSSLREKLFDRGKECLEKAVKIDSKNPDIHFWLAALYGSWAKAHGIMKSLAYVDDIVDELNRVIKLDPNYRKGIAYAVLGRVYFKAPGWPLSIGDNDKAIKYLKKALKMDPKSKRVMYYLADVYYKEDMLEDALKLVDRALSIPIDG